ncbi:hypothetical protein TSUD_104810 [Trifolium subterraneum]|uniref:F-box domain-containing protein n=1 Tax=Trifolium subterraneum TaxID=3900 RepID=A0A2Z6M4T7_TRISU|nr:hypothetical protein TSUD_104810 [Trifolium subterraneum]
MKRQRTKSVYCSELDLDLPDDCWERVFRFVNEDGDEEDDNRRHYLNSISLVSKQFLSITNRHKLCLRICHPTLPFLHRLLRRFTNLTTLDLSHFHGQLNNLLIQISTFPLKQLTSLNISNQSSLPAIGLQAFSSTVTSLTSLTCSNLGVFDTFHDFKLISDCFPFLQQLDLSNPRKITTTTTLTIPFALFKLRKVNLSRHCYVNDQFIFYLFKHCNFLQHVIMLRCYRITNHAIASAIPHRPNLRLGLGYCTGYTYSGILAFLSNCLSVQHLDLQSADFLTDHRVAEFSSFLPHLVSINLSFCSMLTDSAFFSLIRNCTSLTEIIMKSTCIGENIAACNNSMDSSLVYPQFKSLCLAYSSSLEDDKIIMFASLFPNLQLLDLTRCSSITEQGIAQVLRTFCKIRHLNLYNGPKLTSLGINFQLPNLEVLDLTNSRLCDEALCVISISCPVLLQLYLRLCKDIAVKGVMDVVKNCTKLREIYLDDCVKVHAHVVASMVLLRPSLRKIGTPPNFPLTDRNRKFFSRHHGCLLE